MEFRKKILEVAIFFFSRFSTFDGQCNELVDKFRQILSITKSNGSDKVVLRLSSGLQSKFKRRICKVCIHFIEKRRRICSDVSILNIEGIALVLPNTFC